MKSRLFGALRAAGTAPQTSDVQLIDGRFRYTVMQEELEALKSVASGSSTPRRKALRKL